MVPPATFKGLRRWLSPQTDIVNHAIEDLPADRVRDHVCWAHGWQAWKIVKLAPGQMLVPGVINHDTNVARTSSPAPIAALRRGRLSASKLQTIGRRGPLASKRLWP